MNLENGDIDMARIMPLEMVDSLEDDDGVELHMPEIPRIRFLTFDTESEPFDEEDVRRAVNYAIDLEGLTESILAGDPPVSGPGSPRRNVPLHGCHPVSRYENERVDEHPTEASYGLETVR